MLSLILYNLRSLARFDGRDGRDRYWPYVGFVFFLNFASTMVLAVSGMARSFARMQEFAAPNPDKSRIEAVPGLYSIRIEGNHPELMPNMDLFMTATGVLALASVLLLAAAVTRRLHDTGRSGLWGRCPCPSSSAASS